MQHKFPFVSLHIEMEGNDLDVNVHPRKMEVRFARGPEVYDAIYETVRRALTKREMIPQVSVGREEPKPVLKAPVQKSVEVPEPFEVKRRAEKTEILREEPPVYHTPLTKEEEQMFSGTLKEREEKEEKKASGDAGDPYHSTGSDDFFNRKTGWHSEGLQGIRKDIPDTGIRICGASGWRRGTLAGRNPHSV